MLKPSAVQPEVKAPYQPPHLEEHPRYTQVTGISFPIGTNIFDAEEEE